MIHNIMKQQPNCEAKILSEIYARNKKNFSIILNSKISKEVIIRKNEENINFPPVLSFSKTKVFCLTGILKKHKGNSDAIYLPLKEWEKENK